MHLFEKNLRFQIIFPTSLIMVVILFSLVLIIPPLVENNAKERSLKTAINALNQLKLLRAYYTKNVVKKVHENGNMVASLDHYNDANKIPLPATMIHDLSNIYKDQGSTFTLYSAYPFPNRQDRQLDTFQLQAWQNFQKHPSKIIKKIKISGDNVKLRVAISDQMQVQTCVDCHNSHPLTPKNNWKLGDVRGVLEITMDITTEMELAHTLSFFIIAGIVSAGITLIVIFFFLTRRVTNQFSEISQSMIDLGNGDYSTKLTYQSGILEIKQMATAFELFKKTLLERQKLEEQKQLLETEKITSLGQMVAGVAHDVNTLIGIGVTAASFLQDSVEELRNKMLSGQLKKSDLEHFLSGCDKSISMLSHNLNSAAELISSFKEISVDQVSEDAREILLSEYFKSIVHSMYPKIKKAGATVNINCIKDCHCVTYPGALSQIVTNLIANSINHGFEEKRDGIINIDISGDTTGNINIHYTDNGAGIADDIIDKVMIPLFTTKRDKGGSGLGLSIIHNIVTQKLHGSIKLTSTINKGVSFDISFPVLKQPAESAISSN